MSAPSPAAALRVLPGGSAAAQPPSPHPELVALVRASAAGDPRAWCRLVERFDRPLRAVTRFYRLSRWDADDVIQTTWLRFAEHAHSIREPGAVSGWLKTTARRECLRVLQAQMRERPTDDPSLGERSDEAELERELVVTEERTALHAALAELPERHRELMTLLVTEPDMSYEQVGRTLSMPVGSIGPSRARSLDRLRRNAQVQALHTASPCAVADPPYQRDGRGL